MFIINWAYIYYIYVLWISSKKFEINIYYNFFKIYNIIIESEAGLFNIVDFIL